MDNLFEFALLTFTTLFTMVNPLGVIPVYTTMTSGLEERQAKAAAYKAVLTAVLVLILFAVAGKFIFDFFNISVHSLRIVGGVIFFMAGYDMLQARLIRTKTAEETEAQFADDIAITPLGIPIICGPGAITVSIIMYNDAATVTHKGVLLLSIILVMLVTLVMMLSARKVIRFLGENGNKVLLRIMGLIVMVISVEFIFAGLKHFVPILIKGE